MRTRSGNQELDLAKLVSGSRLWESVHIYTVSADITQPQENVGQISEPVFISQGNDRAELFRGLTIHRLFHLRQMLTEPDNLKNPDVLSPSPYE
ncbi:hypothetical protein R1flu_028770 [Riccia fluitans]|uniref:Uncharacterized protein n=1 Tax=Riccia fluitans TaxID=41844 RepID=A0ABD1XMR4_9MARC